MRNILLISLLAAALLVVGCKALARHQATPDQGRQKMEMNGATMTMSGHRMDMGPHMKMTELRPLKLGDQERADEIVRTARRVLENYRDYRAALRDGFEIFLPQVPQKMYHFTNYRYALEAEIHFNPEHPTSLLYEKNGDDYRLVGAMYTAAARLTEDDLDRLIPLSIAQWHEHVNFCMPPSGHQNEMFIPNARFGLAGSIATKEECDKAGGKFTPLIFGWMVHVYLFETKPEDIWSVEEHARMQLGASVARTSTDKAAEATPDVKETTTTFMSEGKQISLEQYEPNKPGKYPAVVLLYGAGGMDFGGPAFQSSARKLAHEGFIVLLPHYFDRTGTKFADLETDKKYFAVWMSTIADAIAYAAKQPNADPQHTGLLGFSLGAYLAVSVASVDPQVTAVVEYFGGMPEFFAKQLKSMPPTLILHGDRDSIVPVKEAYALERLLKEKNIPYKMKIYPQQGHGFNGEASQDAMERTLAFFDNNLKQKVNGTR